MIEELYYVDVEIVRSICFSGKVALTKSQYQRYRKMLDEHDHNAEEQISSLLNSALHPKQTELSSFVSSFERREMVPFEHAVKLTPTEKLNPEGIVSPSCLVTIERTLKNREKHLRAWLKGANEKHPLFQQKAIDYAQTRERLHEVKQRMKVVLNLT